MITLYLKNPSSMSSVMISDMDGRTIDPLDQINITGFSPTYLKNSVSLVELLLSGDLVLNDGLRDLSINEAINTVKGIQKPTLTTDDGKIYTVSSNKPVGAVAYYTSAGDDIANGVIGGGDLMLFDVPANSTVTKDFFFLEDVLFERGCICANNDPTYGRVACGSWVTMEVFAPAGTPYPVNGTGSLDYIDGSFVPNGTGTGMFDINPAESTILSRFVNKVLMSNGDTVLIAPEPGTIPTGYGAKLTIHNADPQESLDACVYMMVFRYNTV